MSNVNYLGPPYGNYFCRFCHLQESFAVSYEKVCHPMNVMWVYLCSVQGQALVSLHAKYFSLVAQETKRD